MHLDCVSAEWNASCVLEVQSGMKHRRKKKMKTKGDRNMSNKAIAIELTDKELNSVYGGNFNPVTMIPGYNDPFRPKFQVPGSIAQGDTLDNTLTMDQLP
jgi:bacteriocin-like protein